MPIKPLDFSRLPVRLRKLIRDHYGYTQGDAAWADKMAKDLGVKKNYIYMMASRGGLSRFAARKIEEVTKGEYKARTLVRPDLRKRVD